MKRALAILCCLVAACAARAAGPAPGVLRWTNGDVAPGNFVGATGSTATWTTPFFDDPVTLAWHSIHRVDWPSQSVGAQDPFIILMRDGSALHGDIVSITGSSIFIHGNRCGDVELKRSEVLSALRTQNNSLLTAGPSGDAGWQSWETQGNNREQDGISLPPQFQVAGGGVVFQAGPNGEEETPKPAAAVPPLVTGPGAAMQIPYWNRGALLFVSLPDSVDIEFHVHCASGMPSFTLSLGAKPANSMRIETWDNEVVAAVGSDFKLIMPLTDADHDVALRFCWDRQSKNCAVYTPGGDQLASWQAPNAGATPTLGLLLQNKGRDLSLDFLRVRPWNGIAPPKLDPAKPRIELDDGRVVQGDVAALLSGTLQLSGTAADQQGQTYALSDVDAFVFSPDSLQTGTAQTTLSFADGTYLRGQVASISSGTAALDTSFTAQPLNVGIDGLRQILVDAPAPPNAPADQPLAKLDTLTIQDTIFHGALAATGDENPRWLPQGAVAPVTPSKSAPYEIDRNIPDDAPVAGAPALFYTRGGDVLPGNLVALDRDGAQWDAGITEATKLPASELKAIQFGVTGRMNMHGFNDPGWRILSGDPAKVDRQGDSLTLGPGTSIGNTGVMQAGEIRFTVDASVFGATRFRMFCAGAERQQSNNFLFATGLNGGIVCGTESTEGQFDDPRFEARVSGTAEVALKILEDDIALYVNGVHMMTFPMPSGGRAGNGLIIEPANVWGNNPGGMKLMNFSTTSPPGCAWLPDVPADARAQALTVPRFERNDPPSHALIAANGDLLRGEVEGVTKDNFAFRAGMEELTVPRDRVKAVICFGKPADASPTPADSPGEDKLKGLIPGWVMFNDSNLDNYISYIQAQVPDIKFHYSQKLGARPTSLRLGQESVKSALGKICAVYDLTYRVDDKGEVYIEKANTALQPSMVERMYWLTSGSFPADVPVATTLADHGVPFPPGATAVWNADARELRVQNTPEAHALLVQVLNSTFGGLAGTPTHWLQLTSGARIALSAEKFGKDEIIGRHPIYGRCVIPTADVAVIRTTPLQPSAAIKSLDDWKLVYAPEPVLPDAGGDSSASIGKPAQTFTVALLAGGQFDLAQQKGKVVVLDFWATWCGPCVASLPELIEAMAPFTPDKVQFIGLDQDEPAAQVKQFIETRGWKLNVALDDGAKVGKLYGVDAIPHTVIIGPDGNVAWVNTGYSPGAEADAAKEVATLLNPPAPGQSPSPAQSPAPATSGTGSD